MKALNHALEPCTYSKLSQYPLARVVLRPRPSCFISSFSTLPLHKHRLTRAPVGNEGPRHMYECGQGHVEMSLPRPSSASQWPHHTLGLLECPSCLVPPCVQRQPHRVQGSGQLEARGPCLPTTPGLNFPSFLSWHFPNRGQPSRMWQWGSSQQGTRESFSLSLLLSHPTLFFS